MALDLNEFREFLRIAKAEGAASVTWGAMHVVFSPGAVEDAQPVIPRRNESTPKRESTSIWHDPNLWAGGGPPKFPTE